MNLIVVAQLLEHPRVPKWHEDHAVMDERRHSVRHRHLLTASLRRGRDERAAELPGKSTLRPELAGGVPEGLRTTFSDMYACKPGEAYLPLAREVAIARGYAEEEAIVVAQSVRASDGIVGLRRCVHPIEDFLGQGLGHSDIELGTLIEFMQYWHVLVDTRSASSSMNARLHGLGDCERV